MEKKKIGQYQDEISNPHYIARLIAAYVNGSINLYQIRQLESWLNKDKRNRELFRYFTDPAFLIHLRQRYWN
jgi:hypothetical protein